MIKYILKRLLLMVPTLIGITIILFILINLVPGGPIEQIIQDILSLEEGDLGFSHFEINKEFLDNLKEEYGFDKPLLIRYLSWFGNFLSLDFGTSYIYNIPAIDVIKRKIPISLIFGFITVIMTYAICIPFGMYKAFKKNKFFDRMTTWMLLFLYSIPGFVLGIILIFLFASNFLFNIFPSSNLFSDHFYELSFIGKIFDFCHHLILPLFCYLVPTVTTMTMLMKNSTLIELNKPYITLARSKGLNEKDLINKHVLRNAIIPIVSNIGNIVTIFFAGNVIVELIFNLEGMGLLTYLSVIKRDYPVIMASISLYSIFMMLGTLFADIILYFVDPRINFNENY